MNQNKLEQSIKGQSNFIKQNILYNTLDKNELPFSSLTNLQLYDGQIVSHDTFNEVLEHFLDNDLFIENYIYSRDTMNQSTGLFSVFHLRNNYNLLNGIENLDGTNRSLMLQDGSKMFLSYDDFQNGDFQYTELSEAFNNAWYKSCDPALLKNIKPLFSCYYGIYKGIGEKGNDTLEPIKELNEIFNPALPVDFMKGFNEYDQANPGFLNDLIINDFIYNPFAGSYTSEITPIKSYKYFVATNKGLFGFDEQVKEGSTTPPEFISKVSSKYINLSKIEDYRSLQVVEATGSVILLIQAVDTFGDTRFFYYSVDSDYGVIESGLREIEGIVVDGVYEEDISSIINKINNFPEVDAQTLLATNNSFWDLESNISKIHEVFNLGMGFFNNEEKNRQFTGVTSFLYDKAGAWLPSFGNANNSKFLTGVYEDEISDTWNYSLQPILDFPIAGVNFIGGIGFKNSKAVLSLKALDDSFFDEDDKNRPPHIKFISESTDGLYSGDLTMLDLTESDISKQNPTVTDLAVGNKLIAYVKKNLENKFDLYFQVQNLDDILSDRWILLTDGNDILKHQIQKETFKLINPMIYGATTVTDTELNNRWSNTGDHWINDFFGKYENQIKAELTNMFDEKDRTYSASFFSIWPEDDSTAGQEDGYLSKYGNKSIKDVLQNNGELVNIWNIIKSSGYVNNFFTPAVFSKLGDLKTGFGNVVDNLKEEADAKLTVDKIGDFRKNTWWNTYNSNYLVNPCSEKISDVDKFKDYISVIFNVNGNAIIPVDKIKANINGYLDAMFAPFKPFTSSDNLNSALSGELEHDVDWETDFLEDYLRSLIADFIVECDGIFDELRRKLDLCLSGGKINGELPINNKISNTDLNSISNVAFSVESGKDPLASLLTDYNTIVGSLPSEITAILNAVKSEFSLNDESWEKEFRTLFVENILPAYVKAFYGINDDLNLHFFLSDTIPTGHTGSYDGGNKVEGNTISINLLDNQKVGSYEILNHQDEFHIAYPENFDVNDFLDSYLVSQSKMLEEAIKMPPTTYSLSYSQTYDKTLLRFIPAWTYPFDCDKTFTTDGLYAADDVFLDEDKVFYKAPVYLAFEGETQEFILGAGILSIPKAYLNPRQLKRFGAYTSFSNEETDVSNETTDVPPEKAANLYNFILKNNELLQWNILNPPQNVYVSKKVTYTTAPSTTDPDVKLPNSGWSSDTDRDAALDDELCSKHKTWAGVKVAVIKEQDDGYFTYSIREPREDDGDDVEIMMDYSYPPHTPGKIMVESQDKHYNIYDHYGRFGLDLDLAGSDPLPTPKSMVVSFSNGARVSYDAEPIEIPSGLNVASAILESITDEYPFESYNKQITRSVTLTNDNEVEYGWCPDNTKVFYMIEAAEAYLELNESNFNPYNDLFQKYLVGENNLVSVSTNDNKTSFITAFTDKGIENIRKFFDLKCDYSMDSLTLEALRRTAMFYKNEAAKYGYNLTDEYYGTLLKKIGQTEIFYKPVEPLDIYSFQMSFINAVIEVAKLNLYNKLLVDRSTVVSDNLTNSPYASFIKDSNSFEANAAAALDVSKFESSSIYTSLKDLLNNAKIESRFIEYAEENPEITITLDGGDPNLNNTGVKLELNLTQAVFQNEEDVSENIVSENIKESITLHPKFSSDGYDSVNDLLTWEIKGVLSNNIVPFNIDHSKLLDVNFREEMLQMLNPDDSETRLFTKFDNVINFIHTPFSSMTNDDLLKADEAASFLKLNVSNSFARAVDQSKYALNYAEVARYQLLPKILYSYSLASIMDAGNISTDQNEYRGALFNKPFEDTSEFSYSATWDESLNPTGLMNIWNNLNLPNNKHILDKLIFEEFCQLINDANSHPKNGSDWTGPARNNLVFWGKYNMFETGVVKTESHKRVDYSFNGTDYGYWLGNGLYWEVYDSINFSGAPCLKIKNFLSSNQELSEFIINNEILDYSVKGTPKISKISLGQIENVILEKYCSEFKVEYAEKPLIEVNDSISILSSTTNSFLFYPIVDILSYRKNWFVAKCYDQENNVYPIYVSNLDKYFQFYDFDQHSLVEINALCYNESAAAIYINPKNDNRIYVYNIGGVIRRESTLSSIDAERVIVTPYFKMEKFGVSIESMQYIEERDESSYTDRDDFLFVFFNFNGSISPIVDDIYMQFTAYKISGSKIESTQSNKLVLGNSGFPEDVNRLQHYLWECEVFDIHKSPIGEFSYVVKERVNEQDKYRIYHMLNGIISPTKQPTDEVIKFLNTNDSVYHCYIFNQSAPGFQLKDADILDQNKYLYKYQDLTNITWNNGISKFMIEKYPEENGKLTELKYYDINMENYIHEGKYSIYYFLTNEGFFIFHNEQFIKPYPYSTFESVSNKYFDIFNKMINVDTDKTASHMTRDHKNLLITELIRDKFKLDDYKVTDFVPFVQKSFQIGSVPEKIDNKDELKTVNEHLPSSIIAEKDNLTIASLVVKGKENPGMISAAVKSPFTSHHPADIYFNMSIDDSEGNGMYFDRAYTDDGFIFDLHKLPIIFKTHSNHTFDLYVNIPTTSTKYLNRVAGTIKSIDNTTRIKDYAATKRSNMNNDSIVNIITNMTTSLRLYIDLDYFNIGKVREVEISGNSVPLSIYRDAEANNSMYDSIAMKSRWNGDQKVIKTNLSANTLRLTFTIYGTDSQSIHLGGVLSTNLNIF